MMAVNVEHAAVATGQGTDVQPVLQTRSLLATYYEENKRLLLLPTRSLQGAY